jgi:hypothetical protein
VSVPLGQSPDYDLIAEADGLLLRIQVKTSTVRSHTPNGHERWDVSISTNGGNQSWNRVAKTFDPSRFDLLFVLTGAGRRWLIPAGAIEATHGLNLGGPKYSEFEIEAANPIDSIVYGDAQPLLESDSAAGEYPSGQRTGSVKPWANAFAGSNPASPIHQSREGNGASPRRRNNARTRVSPSHQITIPSGPFRAAEFAVGDRFLVEATGAGEVNIKRVEPLAQLPLVDASVS